MQTTGIHGTDTASLQGPGWVRIALVAGAVFLAWKAARGLRDLGWSVFGLGVAAYWTGVWPF